MKLLSKYNRVNILTTIIVLLLSAIIYYFFIKAALIHQLDKNLKVEEKEIKDFIQENNRLPEPSNSKDEQELYSPATNEKIIRKFSSVDMYDNNHKEYVSYRQLEFSVNIAGKLYKADVRKSQEETEDIIRLILTITLIMVLILLVSLFLVNRFWFAKLWKPFNSTLQQLKQFHITGKEEVKLEKTNINEFTELNQAVSMMTKRVSKDYEILKSFTENASHEIQTPLAIIKMKLELLMQSENMNATQVDCITALGEATDRLSRLNQSLLLLTKIDNSQFIDYEEVNISNILLGFINNFEELAGSKNICVEKNIKPDVYILMNKALAEIMISNIMTNTLKHNYNNGKIEVNLSDTLISVSNTGKEPTIKTNELFERFKKGNTSTDSLGLGLAIVKKICDTYSFHIIYSYSAPMHTIKVDFKNSAKDL